MTACLNEVVFVADIFQRAGSLTITPPTLFSRRNSQVYVAGTPPKLKILNLEIQGIEITTLNHTMSRALCLHNKSKNSC